MTDQATIETDTGGNFKACDNPHCNEPIDAATAYCSVKCSEIDMAARVLKRHGYRIKGPKRVKETT